MANKTVCIDREYGSNGLKVAKWISRITGMNSYNRSALLEYANANHLVEEEIEPSNPDYDRIHCCEAVKSLSGQRSCIFVGGGAAAILQGRPNNLNVFIKADIESRIRWAMSEQNLDEKAARQFITEMDEKRKEFRRSCSHTETGEPVDYDMMITSSRFGIEGTVEVIRSCMSRI